MDRHVVTHMGLLDAQVCSEGTYDEALEFIRTQHMAGTSNNWSKNAEGKFAPVQCAEHPFRTHYMFLC